jgi:hypothetical protein
MAKQDFGPLGVIDLLTDKELRESMGHNIDHMIRDWLRGIDYMGFAGTGNGTGTLTIPGPNSGYAWSVKLASAQLSSQGVLSVYPADSPNVAPIGTVTSIANGTNNDAVIRWGSNQAVVKDQRNFTFYSSQGVILNYRLLVKQVPAEMQGKL